MASQSSEQATGQEKSPTSPQQRDTMRLARRKACDLCFNKKIKCDMLKPRCSNCVLYRADCKTTIIRRKSAAPKDMSSASSPTSASAPSPVQNETREALEIRLARIENQLQQVLSQEAVSRERQGTTLSASPSRHLSSISPPEQMSLDVGPGSMPHSWTITPTQQGLYEQLPQEHLVVPPLEEIAHVVDHFFHDFNTVTPLFCRASFMVMLGAFYNNPMSRNKAAWAAIQIVIAIGYRTPNSNGIPLGVERSQRANAHLQSAQTVMSDLVTRQEDMLGVQVLLGMAILFMNSSDYKPAAVIVGNAIRLAYQLGLHEAESPKHGPPVEAEQRGRVFWIAYYLDRGLSLRTKTPPAITDNDIDVSLPSSDPGDGAGLIWISGGNNHMHYFRSQIDLAHIEGKIFELLHSNRGSKVRGAEREDRIQHLQGLLNQWYDRIPPLFRVENVVSTLGPCGIMRLTRLFHEYQLAVLNLHGVYNTHDAEWVQQLCTATSAEGGDFSAIFQQLMAPCKWGRPPPGKEGWEECVTTSRSCMKLFHNAFPIENVIWHCACPLFGGTLVLLTNILLYPGHPLTTLDQYICNKSMALLEQVEPNVVSEDLSALKTATRELVRKANATVEGSRSTTSTTAPMSGSFRSSQQALLGAYSGNLTSVMSNQSLDLSLVPAHESLYNHPFREIDFGVEMQGFNPEGLGELGIPVSEPMGDAADYTRYTRG